MNKVSLEINGEKIPWPEIQVEMERLRPEYDARVRQAGKMEGDNQLAEWSEENVVERTLMKQEAVKKLPAGKEHSDKDIHEATNKMVVEIYKPAKPPQR